MELHLADVEVPGGRRFAHDVLHVPAGAGVALVDGPAPRPSCSDRGRVLMLWRHRFVTDTWSWELPAGLVEPGELPVVAAARELEEETGWRPTGLRELAYIQPIAGLSDSEQHVFVTERAQQVAGPIDPFESERVEWVSLAEMPTLIRRREICGAMSVVGLLQLLADRAAGTGTPGPR